MRQELRHSEHHIRSVEVAPVPQPAETASVTSESALESDVIAINDLCFEKKNHNVFSYETNTYKASIATKCWDIISITAQCAAQTWDEDLLKNSVSAPHLSKPGLVIWKGGVGKGEDVLQLLDQQFAYTKCALPEMLPTAGSFLPKLDLVHPLTRNVLQLQHCLKKYQRWICIPCKQQ